MHRNRVVLPLLLSLCLLAMGCAATVTHQGQEITSDAQRTAAQAIRNVDITSASIVRFLIAGHGQGLIPFEVLETYKDDIGPALQDALEVSRNGLERAILSGSDEDTNALLVHVATLMELLNRAAALAAEHGW